MNAYRILFSFLLTILFYKTVDAQFILPLSNEVNNRLESTRIIEGVQFFSLLKPYINNKNQDFSESFKVNGSKEKVWLWRKLFNESLIKVDSGDFYIYADPVFDFRFGKDNLGRSIMVNTRGFKAGGRLGKNIAFGTEFYENQAKFPLWLNKKIQKSKIVPGYGEGRYNNDIWDFAVSSGLISYAPSKAFNFSVGQGKHFLGDGFRSLIFSDATYNYPYLRSEWNNKRFHYFWIIALLQDPRPGTPDREAPYLKKIINTRGISWNLADKLHTSVIYSEIFNNPDTNRRMKHELAVYNPLIIPVPSTSKQSVWALNFTLKLNSGLWIYNQWLFDNLFENSNLNKGIQVGVKQYDAFGLRGVFLQAEYNRVEPETYENINNKRLNWMHYLEPIAHPYGNNFEELNSQIIYNYKRWQLFLQCSLSQNIEDVTSTAQPFFPYYKESERVKHIKSELSYFLNPVTLSAFTIGYQQFTNNITFPGVNNYFYFSFATRLSNRYFDY